MQIERFLDPRHVGEPRRDYFGAIASEKYEWSALPL
jgi:hypothetical protein